MSSIIWISACASVSMGTRVKQETSAGIKFAKKLQSTNMRCNNLPKDSDATDVHLGVAEPFTAP